MLNIFILLTSQNGCLENGFDHENTAISLYNNATFPLSLKAGAPFRY